MTRPRRCAGGQGELECLVGTFDCFLDWRGEAAGDVDGGSGLRVTMGRSFGCRLRWEKASGRCAVSREDDWEKERGSQLPAAANSVGEARRCYGVRRAILLRRRGISNREKGRRGRRDRGFYRRLGVGRGLGFGLSLGVSCGYEILMRSLIIYFLHTLF
jgi:hypothetical protein